jgi:hypothetical protein
MQMKRLEGNHKMPCDKACDGCALTKGAAANCEPNNYLKAMIAVLGPIPFYCHEPLDWEEEMTLHLPPRLLKSMGQLKPCAGWQREVKELAATGYYKENSATTKTIAVLCMKALNTFLREGVSVAEKETARDELDCSFRILVEKKRKFLTGKKEQAHDESCQTT